MFRTVPFAEISSTWYALYGLTTILKRLKNVPRLPRRHAQIIATDGGAPARFVNDCFEAKAGEVVGQFAQAIFNVIGERQPILRVQPAALLFAERFGRRLVEMRRPRLLAALGGSL